MIPGNIGAGQSFMFFNEKIVDLQSLDQIFLDQKSYCPKNLCGLKFTMNTEI